MLGFECPEWNEADLFHRINGTANGTTPGSGDANDGVDNDTDIFVDSSQYDYLKSEDNIVDGEPQPSKWYNLIEDHDWMYGDVAISYSDPLAYYGDYMYKIETGDKNTTTKRYIGKNRKVEEETYYWPSTNKVEAKISLMYMHDVDFANPPGVLGNRNSVVGSWIFFKKDGYNSSQTYEWLSTRFGVNQDATQTIGRAVSSQWGLHAYAIHGQLGVRPVFYVTSKAEIDGGDGTKDSPFVLSLN